MSLTRAARIYGSFFFFDDRNNNGRNQRPSPDELRELLAVDCGIQGRRFLCATEEPETLAALSEILRERLSQKFISAERFKTLHPGIDDEHAQNSSQRESLFLAYKIVKGSLDGGRPISISDMQQAMAGTAMATSEALSALCLALGESSHAVLQEARARGWTKNTHDN